MKTTLLKNIKLPGSPNGDCRVLFNKHTILAIGNDIPLAADDVIDGQNAILLPGAIDAHVHFREPGLTHKADIKSESNAALAGGVTSFLDMPNTLPQTTTLDAFKEKLKIAASSSAINYGFFIGATNDNINEILKIDRTLIPGYKLFLGSSTGNMLVNNPRSIEKLFSEAEAPIVVHAEDEDIINTCRDKSINKYNGNPPVSEHSRIRPVKACVQATKKIIDVARKFPNAHLHIAHVSTSEEVELIRQAKEEGLRVTAEVSPHHLLFCDEDYDRLGARIKMNPAVKSRKDRDSLRKAVTDGIIDIIATDHAPHTLREKEGNALTAVSGAPMVQFSVPVILDLFGEEIMIKTMCENPARIFGIDKRGKLEIGFRPEMTLIQKIEHGYMITDNDVISKCAWTPLIGHTLSHKVVKTIMPEVNQLHFRH